MTCSTRSHTGRGAEQTDFVRRRPFDPRRDVRTPMGYPRDLQRYLHRKWVLQSQTVLALPMSPGIISVGSGRVGSGVRVVGTRDSFRRRRRNVTRQMGVGKLGPHPSFPCHCQRLIRRQSTTTDAFTTFVCLFCDFFVPYRQVICLSVFLER